MEISKDKFLENALKQGINKEQIDSLWRSLEQEDQKTTTSSFSRWLSYFGALIIISAMSWMMTLATEVFGGGGLFSIATAYGVFFTWLGAKLWKRNDLKVPGGLLITVAVCMVPLAIYGLQVYLKLWPETDSQEYNRYYSLISKNWIFMEIGTILAGLLALRYFNFPFLTAPVFFSAWFLSMDIIPLLSGKETTWNQKEWISLIFGMVVLSIAYAIQLMRKKDFAFWGYLFGTLIFWGALTSLTWRLGSEYNQKNLFFFIYCLINISLMIKSILLRTNVLMVFGALGVFIYFSYLAYDVFEGSILFPFVMTLIGLAVIYLGILYQRSREGIEKKIVQVVPDWVKLLLPKE